MKKTFQTTVLALTFCLAPCFSQANVVSSTKVQLKASEIDQVIRLVDKEEPGSSHKKLSIIITDSGLSTDVSPRYSIYLGYASLAEMGNISADFKIDDQAYKVLSAKRISAGIYEVITQEYREDGFYQITRTIDATKMFSDEKKTREKCGQDFCNEELKTEVKITEKADNLAG